MSTAAVGYSAISSYSRVEILHLIQIQPHRSITELVAATGLHPNTVREHLQRLIEDGCIIPNTEHRTTRGRPRILYSAADGAEPTPVQQQKVREAAERGDLMRRVIPMDIPAELNVDALHQVDALVEQLIDSGFDPIVDEEAMTVDLTPCAHAESQAAHRQVLCAVHLGLMQGVVAAAGGPLAVDGMRSSCDPGDCIIQLSLRGGD